tara:strand:- start:1457 stop:1777 length:321 start_codon:yes stop_codon:yes gene_type:complete
MKKKYYTLFVTEESDYHCERIVATYEAEENSNPKDLFDLFLEEQNEKNACWSATEGKIPNNNSSYVVEGITVSDSPVYFIHLDEVDGSKYNKGLGLIHDPSNRLGF